MLDIPPVTARLEYPCASPAASHGGRHTQGDSSVRGSVVFKKARAPAFALLVLGVINTAALVVYLRRDKTRKNVQAISQADSNTAAVIASERLRGLRALEGGDYETAIRAFTQITMLGGGNAETAKLLRIATDLRDQPPPPAQAEPTSDSALTDTDTAGDDGDDDDVIAEETAPRGKAKGPRLKAAGPDRPKKEKRVAQRTAGKGAPEVAEPAEPVEAAAPQFEEPPPPPKPEPAVVAAPPPPPPPAPPPVKEDEPATELSFGAETLVLVAHPSVKVGRVTTTQLRALYAGEQTELGGTKVVLAMRPYGADASVRLLSRIGMQQRPFREHWSKITHYEGRSPPRVIADLDDIARFVGSTPGALCVVLGKDLPGLRSSTLKYIVVSR